MRVPIYIYHTLAPEMGLISLLKPRISDKDIASNTLHYILRATRSTGSVSLLCACVARRSWYFGKIKRLEAEKKLLQPYNDNGAFLIRDSESRRDDYSLSGTTIVESILSSILKLVNCLFTNARPSIAR